MNKKLKLLIFITSGVVVAMLLGVLLLSVVSNLTSVEVSEFKVCATGVSEVNEMDVNDTLLYVLKSNESEKEVSPSFMNKTGENKQRLIYYFVVSDTSVAEVLDKDGAFYLKLKKVGQVSIEVYNGIYLGGEITKANSNMVGKYKVNVLQEIYKIDHVLSTSEGNLMPITVNQKTSGNSVEVAFSSSNNNVANVVKKDGVYYIAFYNEGSAVITAYAAGNASVQDKIYVNVYNNEPNKLEFVDDNGEKITTARMYTDGKPYKINYNLLATSSGTNGISESSQDGLVNCNNVKVVDYSQHPVRMVGSGETIEDSAFDAEDGIVLDKNNNCLYVKKGINVSQNDTFADSVGYVTLQTYIYDENGNEVSSGTYTIFIEIIRMDTIALEIEVSNTPKFSDVNKVLYYNTETYEPLDWANVNATYPPTLYLSLGGEARTLYFKVWYVWNNGDRELARNDVAYQEKMANFSGDNVQVADIIGGEDGTYSILRLTDAFLGKVTYRAEGYEAMVAQDNNPLKDIKVSLRIVCIDLNNVSALYTEDNGIYTFNYWDDRFVSNKVITDKNGNITGFIV